MAGIRSTDISCGVDQIYGLANTTKVLTTIGNQYFEEGRDRVAFLIFSDTVSNSGGQSLVDKIIELELGTITASNEAENPNSGNMIAVWIWEVDFDAWKEWWQLETSKTANEVEINMDDEDDDF